jgi:hypothetical protein
VTRDVNNNNNNNNNNKFPAIEKQNTFSNPLNITPSNQLNLNAIVEAAYYNRGCYQSAIVIKISDPKTLHLKSIKNKPFIIINLSVIVIKLQTIRVHI